MPENCPAVPTHSEKERDWNSFMPLGCVVEFVASWCDNLAMREAYVERLKWAVRRGVITALEDDFILDRWRPNLDNPPAMARTLPNGAHTHLGAAMCWWIIQGYPLTEEMEAYAPPIPNHRPPAQDWKMMHREIQCKRSNLLMLEEWPIQEAAQSVFGRDVQSYELDRVQNAVRAGAIGHTHDPHGGLRLSPPSYLAWLQIKAIPLPLEFRELVQLESKTATALARAGENARVEFKATARWDLRQGKVNKDLERTVVEEVAAFLNTDGGTLLIGVADDGTALGLDNDYQVFTKRKDRDGYENWLMQMLLHEFGNAIAPCLRASFPRVDGVEICLVQVQPAPRAVYLSTGQEEHLYIRAGNSKKRLNAKETVEYVNQHWA